MQPRVLHLLRGLGLDPRRTPASNVVFVRTSREADLQRDKVDLLAACWPVHAAVIEALRVKAIVCFGRTSGAWVRDAMHAHEEVGRFVEANERKWVSRAHRSASGHTVLTLTHPSIANWKAPQTDCAGRSYRHFGPIQTARLGRLISPPWAGVYATFLRRRPCPDQVDL